MRSPAYFTQQDVVKMLKQRQGTRTLDVFAKEVGVSLQFVHNVLSGYRSPGEQVLHYLRMEKVTLYRKK